MNLLCDGRDRRRTAALEPDVDTLRGFNAFGDLECLLSLDDINTNRLFAVNVLPGSDGRIEVLYMEEGRRRDLDKIDFGGTGELLEGVRAVEEQFAADGLPVKAGVELIKMAVASSKLIGKKIGQRYHLSRRVFRERCRDCSAARAAAK